MLPDQSPHVLDRPIWRSLMTYHAKFAIGTDLAKRYPADMAMFAGIADRSQTAVRDLEQIVAPGEALIVDGVQQAADLPGWTMLQAFEGYQMVCDQPLALPNRDQTILELSADDVPDILRLIEITHPGPFGARTIELGRHIGIRHDGQLIALAGERDHVPGYHEISSVCTHPNFQGKGYARLLVGEMVAGHRRQGEISFLHVVTENTRAIKVYESLGFHARAEAQGLVMQR